MFNCLPPQNIGIKSLGPTLRPFWLIPFSTTSIGLSEVTVRIRPVSYAEHYRFEPSLSTRYFLYQYAVRITSSKLSVHFLVLSISSLLRPSAQGEGKNNGKAPATSFDFNKRKIFKVFNHDNNHRLSLRTKYETSHKGMSWYRIQLNADNSSNE